MLDQFLEAGIGASFEVILDSVGSGKSIKCYLGFLNLILSLNAFYLKDKLIIVKPSIGPNRPLNYNRTFITILFSLTQSTTFTTSCSLLGLSRRVGQLTSIRIVGE